MNVKLFIIGLMMSLLLALSASGQLLTPQQVILQDDKSGDHLAFNIATGEYKFESCSGNLSIAGIGKVSVSGCKVDLKDLTDTRRVLAEVDLCVRVGKADIAIVSPVISSSNDLSEFESVISDSSTPDSVFDCAFKTIDPK